MNKKRIVRILCCGLVSVLGITMMATNDGLTFLTHLIDNLPVEVHGWQKAPKSSVYHKDNLFEYINGGAELYISYDFRHLVAGSYSKENIGEIKIDLFDMGTSANAYGVFQHSREDLDRFVAPDVESEYAAGLLTFWKGPYYVSILAYPETEQKKQVVKELAVKISQAIHQESKKPALLSLLPGKNLLENSIRYFHHYIWLNSHYFISNQNILHMDSQTDAVLAKYQLDPDQKKQTLLLMVSYPDEEKAKTAYLSFMDAYLPDAKEGFKQLEDNRWTGCFQKRSQVHIVLNAPTKESAAELIEQINF